MSKEQYEESKRMYFSGPEDDDEYTEQDYLEDLRQQGPDPTDYQGEDGNIDWDTYDDDYDEWAEETGFPNNTGWSDDD